MGKGRGWFTGVGDRGGISDGAGGGDQLVMHSSSIGMMLRCIGGVGMLALLEVAVVVGMLALLAVAVGRLIRHILAPLDSRMPHRMILPWALYTVTSVLVKVTVQLASLKTPMLRRLLMKLGMIFPVDVPGGSHGRLMVAGVDDCSSCPVALLIVDGAVL